MRIVEKACERLLGRMQEPQTELLSAMLRKIGKLQQNIVASGPA